ncbi:MAG: hypothetical protein II893_04770 [Methanomicrobium sp.]|nr:hypothetical protein [Methanomicrobium sp.]
MLNTKDLTNIMKCSKCACDAVITQRYSGMSLCPLHFTEDFESRAKKAIRKHRWLSPNDCIAVDFDGSFAAAALLHLLAKFFGKRPDIRLIAVGDDEETLKEVAEIYGIEYAPGSALRSPDIAGELGCTKIAVAATLDSEAEFVFECILKGDSEGLLSRGRGGDGEIPMIMPIMNIPAAEAELYCRIHGIDAGDEAACEIRDNGADAEFPKLAKELLDDYADEHPAAKYALVNLMEEFQNADMRDDSEREI